MSEFIVTYMYVVNIPHIYTGTNFMVPLSNIFFLMVTTLYHACTMFGDPDSPSYWPLNGWLITSA